MSINIHEAKTHFSKLIERVIQGEEITIARGGRPVARLVPVGPPKVARKPGSARGQVEVRSDFEAPLSEELINEFH